MNRFMKKFKAVYCNASFIFAIAVLMVTISLCIFYPDSVNASQSPSPSGDISTNDVTNDLDDVKSLDSGDKDLADATSDSTNGLNIYYNNESGSLSTPVRMFLVLTSIIFSTFYSHHADFFYKNYYRTAFCQNSYRYPDSTT